MRSCLIMGCGRSGTSAMAGLLSGIGYFQGERLLKPKEDNPKGFFEDRLINDLNERIMGSAIHFTRIRRLHRLFPQIPLRSNGWMAVMPLSATVRASETQQREIEALVRRAPYCFKDPRFSFTYPAWRPFVEGGVLFVIFRDPAEVCASVLSFFSQRKAHYKPDFVYAVWLRAYEHILRHWDQGGRWLFVDYHDLLTGEALPRIESALETATNRSMIDPSLNRAHTTAHELAAPAECQRMYEQLLQLGKGGGGA